MPLFSLRFLKALKISRFVNCSGEIEMKLASASWTALFCGALIANRSSSAWKNSALRSCRATETQIKPFGILGKLTTNLLSWNSATKPLQQNRSSIVHRYHPEWSSQEFSSKFHWLTWLPMPSDGLPLLAAISANVQTNADASNLRNRSRWSSKCPKCFHRERRGFWLDFVARCTAASMTYRLTLDCHSRRLWSGSENEFKADWRRLNWLTRFSRPIWPKPTRVSASSSRKLSKTLICCWSQGASTCRKKTSFRLSCTTLRGMFLQDFNKNEFRV